MARDASSTGAHADGRELRRDPLSGRWAAIAPGRARRPGAGGGDDRSAGGDPADCPFCEGHEAETPPETFAIGPAGRAPDTPGWLVRVVPNLFPAFSPHQAAWEQDGLLAARAAHGVQEVVVNAPRHVRSLADLDDDELGRMTEAWSARAAAARAAGFGYIQAIVNEGRRAGASLAHTHSQLVWLDEEPPAVREERGHMSAEGGCVLCRLLQRERREGARIVADSGGVVCLAAWAGRQPYELLVAPADCEADPYTSPRLAAAMRLAVDALRALHELEGRVAVNLWVHTAGHWHIELLPRMSVEAGVELGAGISINTLAPEEGAERLRTAMPRRAASV